MLNDSSTERTAIYLTPEGVEKLREEMDHLTTVKRPALAARLRHAIQQGDLSENADYITAKEEQGFLEGRILQIDALLRQAIVVDKADGSDAVGLGHEVTVVERGSDLAETFVIVGSAEADPAAGKVSCDSPMGQALMGRSVGDRVTVRAPSGDIAFEITAIG